LDPERDYRIEVGDSAALTAREREQVHALFARAYEQANHDYIDSSLSCLGTIARARDGDTLVGFALTDVRFAELPRFDAPQLLLLAGIGCVELQLRRCGLFSHLSRSAARANGLLAAREGRFLACGRMGHPAGFRAMSQLPTVIPREGRELSDWHLEVGAVVAGLYGVRLKPGSLIVEGSGRPVGHPRIEIDVAPEEWLPFRDVDRSRGDSLLGMAWQPDVPDGW
jgi:hypothetical protein